MAEIRPGVFALSNLVDLRRPVSWVPAGARGFDPSNCYLLLAAGEAQLVDTGLRAHAASLVGQIAEVIAADVPLHVALTRVEPDCLGGLLQVAERFRVVSVASQSNVIPFDYIGPFSGRFPGVEIVNGLHPGDALTAGGRRLLVVEPAVRTLPTLWYHDEATGTLFSSDFFSEQRIEDETAWRSSPVSVAATRRHLLAKFDWLEMADTSQAVGRLDSVFERLEVTGLAPGHGLWTTGTEAVGERRRTVRRALESAAEALVT